MLLVVTLKVLIDGIVYDVIIERKNNKNTYLRVKEDLNIYVTTSYLTPDFMIKKFVLNNKEFILKQMDKMEKRLDKILEYYYLMCSQRLYLIVLLNREGY